MKKFLSVVLVVLILVSSLGTMASAAGDSISAATSISLNSTYNGSITSSSTIDYYKFTVSNSGRVTLKLSAEIKYAFFYIYQSTNTSSAVWSTGGKEWNSTTELIVLNNEIDLTAGTYYFCVKQGLSYTGNYSFRLDYTSANESFKEAEGGNNNKSSLADSISLGTKYYGQIASNDTKDFYKFTVPSSGNITLEVSAEIPYSFYYIYNSSVSEVWRSGGMSWNSSTELLSMNKTISLSAGTYYFCVEQGLTHTGKYNFKITGPSGSGGSSGTSTINLSASKSSVTIKEGDTADITFSYTGSNSNSIKSVYSVGDKSIISCSWGSWKSKSIPVTISGLKAGTTTLKLTLKDSVTNKVLDTETVNITVTSDSSSGSGGSSESADSDSTGFFLFDIFFLIIGLIAVFLGLA